MLWWAAPSRQIRGLVYTCTGVLFPTFKTGLGDRGQIGLKSVFCS